MARQSALFVCDLGATCESHQPSDLLQPGQHVPRNLQRPLQRKFTSGLDLEVPLRPSAPFFRGAAEPAFDVAFLLQPGSDVEGRFSGGDWFTIAFSILTS